MYIIFNTHLLQCVVVVGAGRSQAPLALTGWWPHSDPERKLRLAQLSGGHRVLLVSCWSAELNEECCSLSFEGSAETQVGLTSVCCVGLVGERHKQQAVALAGTEAPPCLTVGLVVVLAVTDFAVLPLVSSFPDFL